MTAPGSPAAKTAIAPKGLAIAGQILLGPAGLSEPHMRPARQRSPRLLKAISPGGFSIPRPPGKRSRRAAGHAIVGVCSGGSTRLGFPEVPAEKASTSERTRGWNLENAPTAMTLGSVLLVRICAGNQACVCGCP
jgi:hypothetical protein